MRFFYPFCGILLVLILLGCTQEAATEKWLSIHTHTNAANELWVTVGNTEPQLLLKEALNYRPVLSQSGQWLAVEMQLMSNLTVVRLFEMRNNQFTAVENDITRDAWRRVTSQKEINLNDVEAGSTYLSGFSNDESTLILELHGALPGQDMPFYVKERVKFR